MQRFRVKIDRLKRRNAGALLAAPWRNHGIAPLKNGMCLILILALVACGSSGGSSTETPSPTVTPSPAPALTMEPLPTVETPNAPAITPTVTEPPDASDLLEGHVLGPENAAVTIIMYGDFQCEVCARYARDLEVLRARYPDDVRLIWRHLPDLRTHDKAALAVQASEAAAAQDQFWQMHDQLFTHQAEWIGLPPDEFRARLYDYAAVTELDLERFRAALDSGIYGQIVDRARRDAAELELVAAPVLLLNGVPYDGRDDLFGLDEAVRLALLARRHFDAPPPMALDPAKSYRATLITGQGSIVIDLFADQAPNTVNNFVFLARQGWYDGGTFFYVVPDFLAQTGDPSDTGRGGPGYTIPGEHDNGLRFDRPGLVAMAHPPGVPDGAGSAFFITLAPLQPSAEWDGQYTIFGVVVNGLDVAQRLTPRNTNDPVNFPDPPPGDRVIRVTIEEMAP